MAKTKQTVLDNLDNTIAVKEQQLVEWKSVKSTLHPMMYQTLVPVLELNINELKRIRAGVALFHC